MEVNEYAIFEYSKNGHSMGTLASSMQVNNKLQRMEWNNRQERKSKIKFLCLHRMTSSEMHASSQTSLP